MKILRKVTSGLPKTPTTSVQPPEMLQGSGSKFGRRWVEGVFFIVRQVQALNGEKIFTEGHVGNEGRLGETTLPRRPNAG